MVTFRNNRRGRFRNNDRNFKRNGEINKIKFKNEIHSNGFQRRQPHRNNQNLSKLIEKYNNLAREALANEDKILSESYFQFAEHFVRTLDEQKNKSNNSSEVSDAKTNENIQKEEDTQKDTKEEDNKIVSI